MLMVYEAEEFGGSPLSSLFHPLCGTYQCTGIKIAPERDVILTMLDSWYRLLNLLFTYSNILLVIVAKYLNP